MPDGLRDTAGNNPFSNVTVDGLPTLATVWTQTTVIQRSEQSVAIGGLITVSETITVTETESQGLYTEPTDGVFDTTDPITSTQLVMGAELPSSMELTIVDADPDLEGIQGFVNDLLGQDDDLLVDGPLVLYTGPTMPISIVSPSGTIIAVNRMRPYQATSVGEDAFGRIDNAWGFLLDPWTVLADDVDGEASDFLDGWEDMPQLRTKPHPGGWTTVVVGSPVPGPAGVLHCPPGGGGDEGCCLPDGTCEDLPPEDCTDMDGTPLGPTTSCETSQCLGRCCRKDGSCEETTAEVCDAEEGGDFGGLGTFCFGDSDDNGYDDACEPDCNDNGIADNVDIELGLADDIDEDGLIDDCDEDGDGVLNIDDNCPSIANGEQADRDEDRVGDVCDNCPEDANPDQADDDEDGMGDACELVPSTPTGCGSGACGAVGVTPLALLLMLPLMRRSSKRITGSTPRP